jgi:hypothetical protein
MSPRADSIFRSRQTDGRNVGTSFGLYTLSGNQTTNLTAPSHVQFDQEEQVSADMVGSLSVGTAQQLGIVTLPGGKLWECEAAFSCQATGVDGQLCCSLFDLLAVATFGVGGMEKMMAAVENANHSPQAKGFIDTRDRAGVVTVEFRILSGTIINAIFAGSASVGPTWMKVRSI